MSIRQTARRCYLYNATVQHHEAFRINSYRWGRRRRWIILYNIYHAYLDIYKTTYTFTRCLPAWFLPYLFPLHVYASLHIHPPAWHNTTVRFHALTTVQGSSMLALCIYLHNMATKPTPSSAFSDPLNILCSFMDPRSVIAIKCYVRIRIQLPWFYAVDILSCPGGGDG